MKNNDQAFKELLDLLKTHPELMRELVFDQKKIQSLLGSKVAREMVCGVDANTFLTGLADPADGYPIAQCLETTKIFCAKGTGAKGLCAGGTGSE